MIEPLVLGVNLSHNGSACLMRGTQILCAIQEERLTRRKYERIFGAQQNLCIEYVLKSTGHRVEQLDLIVVAVQGDATDPRQDIRLNPQLRVGFRNVEIEYLGHHLAHAWCGYGLSGFADSAILVIDGCGSACSDLGENERAVAVSKQDPRYEAISIYSAEGDLLTPIWKDVSAEGKWFEARPPNMAYFRSLGGMYEAVADFTFGIGNDAGKVMGLAPYGKPSFPSEAFLTRHDTGFQFSSEIPNKIDPKLRKQFKDPIVVDLAASVQRALEESMMWLVQKISTSTDDSRLCYSGGVALNSVANQHIFESRAFEDIFITAPADDSGIAIGAASYGIAKLAPKAKRKRQRSDSFGRTYSAESTRKAAERFDCLQLVDEPAADIADRIVAGQIVALFTGGSEFGPRALGQRSILCDPRDPDAKDRLNSRVKHREEFRPYAPVALLEFAEEWFDFKGTDTETSFMLRVIDVVEARRQQVPAITHVDGTARLQTISRDQNPSLHEIVTAFHALTGVPILLNTSFNVMSEPIVETPEEALYTLLENDLDAVRFDEFTATRADNFTVGDLRPQSSVRALRADRSSDSGKTAYVAFVETPYGDRSADLNHSAIGLLNALDGKRSISQLFEEQQPKKDGILYDEFLKRVFDLRRRGLVRYC